MLRCSLLPLALRQGSAVVGFIILVHRCSRLLGHPRCACLTCLGTYAGLPLCSARAATVAAIAECCSSTISIEEHLHCL